MIMILVLYMTHARFWPMINILGMMDFYLRKTKLCVSNCYLRESLVREAHMGGLMGHFGITKTLKILHEHFYWPNMKRDV